LKPEYTNIVVHLLTALAAGGLIGYERSYSGRPAGFRTHTLVCMASSLLMLITVYQDMWFGGGSDLVRIDPTRMAQGIMTGIGFLGAGVIVKEGVSVRGLTTAASIWITAAIGVLCGAGFYFPVLLGTLLTLGTLSVFRWIEGRMPSLFYVHYVVRFETAHPLPEGEFRAMVREHGFVVAEVGYHLNAAGHYFEYRGVMRTLDKWNMRKFAETLRHDSAVVEFKLAPTGD
jgi:putative Mg2+ transporter-C (MgtC) family protein